MSKRVLICPLNWGLGHATRCVPVIDAFLKQGAEVLLAADGAAYDFLKNEFPNLKLIFFEGYNIRYPKNNSMTLAMLLQTPKLLSTIKREHKQLEKLISDYKIDIVVSDNRYGLWTKKIPCVFISHQLNIQTPAGLSFLKPILKRINYNYISKYNRLWIPDVEGENNLSGNLSHPAELKNAKYIGPLSRFSASTIDEAEKKYKLLVLLSGAEPQRSILEQKLLLQLKNISEPVLFVRGIFSDKVLDISENVDMKNFLSKEELLNAFLASQIVICRSGYSTLMELAALGKKAILIPTPGQTEQEYLAEYFFKKKIFYSAKQSEFDLKKAIEESEEFSGIEIVLDNLQLVGEISQLLN